MSKSEPPLARLRRIRDAKQRADKLAVDRDDLIREALAEGNSERKVALAVGLSPGRVNRIAHRLR
jgi:hypothetical protein